MSLLKTLDMVSFKSNHVLMSLRVFISFLFFLSLPLSALALDIPPPPKSYVADYAGLLPEASAQALNTLLSQYERETSNQIVVALFPSLEGESIEDFSIRLAEQWEVGQKGKDNGVILLVFVQDRQLRIEVGYGLEGALPDAVASQIIRNEIVPYFKEGKYEAGIVSGVRTIQSAIQGEFSAEGAAPYAPDFSPFLRLAGIFLAFILFVDLIRYSLYFSRQKNRPGHYSWWGWFVRFALFLFVLRIVMEIAFRGVLLGGGHGGSSSGGFRGGGGSFGGGGASGRW